MQGRALVAAAAAAAAAARSILTVCVRVWLVLMVVGGAVFVFLMCASRRRCGGCAGPWWVAVGAARAAGTSRRIWIGAWHVMRLRFFFFFPASVGGCRVALTTWRGGGGVQQLQAVRRVAWKGVGSAVVVSGAGCGLEGGWACARGRGSGVCAAGTGLGL